MPGISILQDPLRKAQQNQTLTLADGRCLGYAEFGSFDEDAIPVFFLHGRPGCRLHAAWFHEAAYTLNLRVIGVDRPGYGASTPKQDFKVLDCPSDLSEVAKHLKLGKYYILGYSAGGPYALACAHALPNTELLGVGLLSSLGPYETAVAGKSWASRMYYNFSYYMPWLACRMASMGFADFEAGKDQNKMIETFLNNIPPTDRDFLRELPEKTAIFPISIQDGFRQGFKTHFSEKGMLSSDWGFEIEDIRDHNIQIWHGTNDVNVPLHMGRYFEEHLPHASLKEFEGDTHYTINRHAEEILRDLVATT